MSNPDFPDGARVSYDNGHALEYGVVTLSRSSSSSGLFVLFDGDTTSKHCYTYQLTLVEDTVESSNEELTDEIVRHNKFKEFEEDFNGLIPDDKSIWNRGYDSAISVVEEKLKRLKAYEEAGSPEDFARLTRRSELLDEHIASQPTPIKQAWRKIMIEKKAL